MKLKVSGKTGAIQRVPTRKYTSIPSWYLNDYWCVAAKGAPVAQRDAPQSAPPERLRW